MPLKIFQNPFRKTTSAEALENMQRQIATLNMRVTALERAKAVEDHQQTKRIAAVLSNYFKQRGLDIFAVQNATGITVPVLEKILRGDMPLTRAQAKQLQAAYGMEPEYLIHGKGRIFTPAKRKVRKLPPKDKRQD